jgi:hypothetical protein
VRSVDSCCAIGRSSVDATKAFRILAVRAALAALAALEALDVCELLVECDRVDAFPLRFAGVFPLAAGLVVLVVDAVLPAVVFAVAGACGVAAELPEFCPETGETAIITANA